MKKLFFLGSRNTNWCLNLVYGQMFMANECQPEGKKLLCKMEHEKEISGTNRLSSKMEKYWSSCLDQVEESVPFLENREETHVVFPPG